MSKAHVEAAREMARVARDGARSKTYYADACDLLDRLAAAKARLDAADPSVATTTATLLDAARTFVDDTTIPCTEWPTTEEVADHVEAHVKLLGLAECQ